jgi:fructose-bisphosphate aldolase class II
MMREGEKVLSRIPGVRRVITAHAVQQDAGYKYSWLIEFVHNNVIDSYRDHPDHVAFADKLFRPIAGDRISIDFSENCYSG